MIAFTLKEAARMGALLAMLFLGAACASEGHQRAKASSQDRATAGRPATKTIEKQLWSEFRAWEGTRHAMGGTGSGGIDCSAFVQAVYTRVFNIHLPRTTKDQVSLGFSVPREQLRPGDLVFFRPPTYPRHVGIYISDNAFIHASKTKGVTVSKIDRAYWGRYYWTARRVLSPMDAR